MKNKRLFFALVLTTLLIPSVLPLTVLANAPGPNVDGSYEVHPLVTALFVLISLEGIALTCFVEWLVAKPFGLRKGYGKQIILTNLVTQIVMRATQLWLSSAVPNGVHPLAWYAGCVIALEILVCIGEILIYCRIMQDVSRKRICLFTIVANITSAVCGLLLFILI